VWEPVPGDLRALLDEAIDSGLIEDYLVPPEGYLQRKGERDDRVIWRLMKRVAARAGVDAHVHALRGAFAAYCLSLHPGDVEALKELLGHRSIATTQVYVRKFDKATAMERVRSLSWGGVAEPVNGSEPGSSKNCGQDV
jgi:integrase